ncbi:MAG: DEAD/DEAH box helicase [bacterium]|nr:DEAD/DEAH box helicase [bacterium]
MITRSEATNALCQAVGRDDVDFREGQWEAIEGILNYRRQIVVQRTGWGKSMIYFLAAKFLRKEGRGMTLLISPLIALMRNQNVAAEATGIRCHTINSTNEDEYFQIRELVLSGKSDLLIISPERLANDAFRKGILEQIADKIGLLVIDEAHCISDWGHDFRPNYKRISRLLEHLPKNVPVLATTATATQRVVEDIEKQLGEGVQISRGNLARESLYLQNISLLRPEARLAWLSEQLRRNISGTGIIYTLTTRDANGVAKWLRQTGVPAYAYFSKVLPPEDMDAQLRTELEARPDWQRICLNGEIKKNQEEKSKVYRIFLEELLLANRIKALVATSALSMGFDKPDLEFVIHYQRPKSVVDYYQQVGRAGRGIPLAYGVLLHGEEDDKIADYFIRDAFPSEENVRKVLELIKSSPNGFSIPELKKQLNIRAGKMEKLLEYVMSDTPQPIVKDGSKYRATPYIHTYCLPTETIERLTTIRRREQAQMDAYVRTDHCLMHFLCSALDSPLVHGSCGQCAVCRPERRLPETTNPELVQQAATFLRLADLPIEPRKQWADKETAAQRFGIHSAKIPEELAMEEGRALSRYGIGEFGQLVQKGKYETHPPRFDDQLVEACAQMVLKWAPEKWPSWVVPVPSHRSSLVEDFAVRLANRLRLPCVSCFKKNVETQQQKEMENSAFQQNNILNAFTVEGSLPPGGCLLVDDMVDSKWTFTVATAVLRQAGAEFVLPLALADSSNGGD